jgi:hypothetical protein
MVYVVTISLAGEKEGIGVDDLIDHDCYSYRISLYQS